MYYENSSHVSGPTPFKPVLFKGQLYRVSKELLLHAIQISGEGNGTPLQYSCLENPLQNGRLKPKLINNPTLCKPVDYTVHGIFQAIILEW